MSRSKYYALYRNNERSYFKELTLDYPDGTIPPPIIAIGDQDYHPTISVEFVYADSQQALAKAYNTSQQNVSRWLKAAPSPNTEQEQKK